MAVSLETIDYQLQDSFPGQLESLITKIYHALDTATWRKAGVIQTHPAYKQIEQLIFDRLGLRVVFSPELNAFSSAAIVPFFKDYQKDASSLQGFLERFTSAHEVKAVQTLRSIVKERRKSVKLIHNKTGYVNTKLAKVGGYLSEVRHYLILDVPFFKKAELSAPELTAIVLHEIGHAFDGMEEHYRMQSTNRAILDVLVDLHDNKPDKALYKYKNAFTAQEYQIAQLSTSKDRQDFCGALALRYVGEVQSQLQNNKYDETNFENMADTFATRFGRGKDLVSALAKLQRSSLTLFDNSRAIRVTMVSLDTLSMACLFLLVPVYGFILYTVVMAYLLRISADHMTYDAPIERMLRIRNTVVNGLKNKHLPPEMVKDALEQIDFIEKMVGASVAYRSLLSEVGNWVFSDARRDRYYVDLQQAIEAQLNNRLFVQAAQLRVAG